MWRVPRRGTYQALDRSVAEHALAGDFGDLGDRGGVEPRATDQWLPVPSAKGVQVGGGSFHHTVRVS
jgi:hypothetical protein